MLRSQAVPTQSVHDTGANASTWYREAPTRMLDVDYARLAYWRVGSGPDLVFIHGWPLHAATFRAIVPQLSAHYTCHLLDLPASGQSQADSSAPIDFKSYATAVRRAIDALGLERYALLAHDSGGLVARFLAAQDSRVTSMVLIGTEISGHRALLVRLLKIFARVPFGTNMFRLSIAPRLLRKSALGFGPAFANPDHLDGEFHTLFMAPLLASSVEAARQLAVVGAIDWRWLDELPQTHAKINIPVQLIWGRRDGLFPVARARRMASEFARPAQFVEVAKGKTFLHEDMPEALLEHALPFLQQHVRGGTR